MTRDNGNSVARGTIQRKMRYESVTNHRGGVVEKSMQHHSGTNSVVVRMYYSDSDEYGVTTVVSPNTIFMVQNDGSKREFTKLDKIFTAKLAISGEFVRHDSGIMYAKEVYIVKLEW